MTALAGGPMFSSAWLWYMTRGTAMVAFVLLTVSVALGVAATQRGLASARWPRFATQDLHRNVSLLAVGLLLLHILTTLADTFVDVGWWSLVVPFAAHYRTTWVALGTTAFDTFLIVVGTSLIRHRLPRSVWRDVHWAVYAAWPLAALHFWKTGTDAAHDRFGLWLLVACVAAVLVAVATRLSSRDGIDGTLPSVGGVK